MRTCHPELSTWRPDAGTRASSKSFPKEASGWPAPGWRHLPSRTTPSSSLASTPGEVPCLPARSAAALWTTVLQFQTVWQGGEGPAGSESSLPGAALHGLLVTQQF